MGLVPLVSENDLKYNFIKPVVNILCTKGDMIFTEGMTEIYIGRMEPCGS